MKPPKCIKPKELELITMKIIIVKNNLLQKPPADTSTIFFLNAFFTNCIEKIFLPLKGIFLTENEAIKTLSRKPILKYTSASVKVKNKKIYF